MSDCLKGHKCQVNGTKIKQVIIYFKATYFSALKCRRYNRVVLLLFQQLGSELTALADGRGPGALRAREAINSTPTANTNHHHHVLLQHRRASSKLLAKQSCVGFSFLSTTPESRLQPFSFHLAVFRWADDGLTTDGTDQRRERSGLTASRVAFHASRNRCGRPSPDSLACRRRP